MDYRLSKKKKNLNNFSFRMLGTLFFLSALLVFSACTGKNQQQPEQPLPETNGADILDSGSDLEETGEDMTTSDSSEKTFSLTGKNFAFVLDGKENPELRVKQGDTVTVELKVTEGFHDWVVDEFSAKTQQMKAGSMTTVTFVADKQGTFEYYCSVGSHRQQGMKGTLVVE